MHTSFLTYQGGRWFWIASVLSLIAIGIYGWHDLPEPPNGGTWLGYTLGTIGALLIVWLLYLGRRKRNYSSKPVCRGPYRRRAARDRLPWHHP